MLVIPSTEMSPNRSTRGSPTPSENNSGISTYQEPTCIYRSVDNPTAKTESAHPFLQRIRANFIPFTNTNSTPAETHSRTPRPKASRKEAVGRMKEKLFDLEYWPTTEHLALTGANSSLTAANISLTNANCLLTSVKCSLTRANCFLTSANCLLTTANSPLTSANCSLTGAKYPLTALKWPPTG
ncbi:MAG: hypothetical protein QOD00_3650 [Blastocatellia bacterium]|jgi:hypothetical protein|nr:hypothetical protein [Blastocatellia bacterium]